MHAAPPHQRCICQSSLNSFTTSPDEATERRNATNVIVPKISPLHPHTTWPENHKADYNYG